MKDFKPEQGFRRPKGKVGVFILGKFWGWLTIEDVYAWIEESNHTRYKYNPEGGYMNIWR